MSNDLRFALRQLVKNRGFTTVATLTLALGIGANTVVFSWIRTVLLDTVPGAERADRLVVLCPRHVSGSVSDTMSFLDNRDLAAETNVFAGIFGSQFSTISLRVGKEVEWAWAESATANFFDVLGVKPVLGRFFTSGEDTHPGADTVAVLNYDFWQRRFGGDRGVIGRVVEISNRPFTIVGIAPPGFGGAMGGLRFDLWIPVSMFPEFNDVAQAFNERSWRFLHTYARLQPGVTLARAQAAAGTVMRRLESEFADSNRDMGVVVLPVWKSPYGGQSVFLPLLRSLAFVAALLLLLVAANVANLLLARATRRHQEVALRLALGANRLRLVRQLLTESVFLAGLGGVLGCLFAAWGVNLLVKLMPATHLPVSYHLHLSGGVLLASAAITIATGVLFGFAPALQAVKTDLNDALKQGGRTGAPSGRSHWLRGALVVCEITLAVVLLIGMTLCARSLQQARRMDVGLDPRNVWCAGFRLPTAGYDNHQVHLLYRRMRQELAALPGVEYAALSDWLPLGFEGGSGAGFSVAGYQPAPGEAMDAGISVISPDYFRALHIPVLSGREFAENDDAEAPRVAIVNQFVADRYFSGRNPVGLKIRVRGDDFTIVGVVKNGKYRSLSEPQQAYLYAPEAQVGGRSLAAVVRTVGDPRAVAQTVARAAAGIDPLLKPVAATTLIDYTAAAFAVPRMASILLAVLGMAALLLAALGIYGVMSFSVSQRVREIGVRMALGAQKFDVLRLFVKQGMGLAGIGLILGVLGGFAAARVLASLLVGVTASDPLTYGSVASALAAVAFVACWLPARRATRIDPMEALRYE